MKTNKLLSLAGLLLTLFLAACNDDAFTDNTSQVEEGLPANIQLKFNTQANRIVSRAERDPEYENRVDNIYVFIFDEAGKVHGRKFCSIDNGLSYTDNQKKDQGTAQITTLSLNKALIVGIANLTTDNTATAYNITEEELNTVNTLDELRAKIMRMRENSVERGGLFMMTGYAKDENGNTEVTIPGDEGTIKELACTLELERTDAKIKFEIKTEQANSNWTEFSFLPKTWTVKKVPAQSYILKAENGDYNETDAVYFNTPDITFEEITRNDEGKIYTGGSFVFYMPENKKTALKTSSNYAQRDSWEGTDSNGDKQFTNANANTTYVEMTGTLSYKDESGKYINADVRLIIHLGYASGQPDDYNTERNTYYTYTVTIKGVNDIEVEVKNGNEVLPGYEGDVVQSEKGTFEFDSHYDRCLITINPAQLGEKVYWSVNTPFSRGIHEVTDGTEIIEESMRDYRWIKFAINADYGVGNNEFVKYPGDQNYNDPYPLNGTTEGTDYNASSPYYTTDGRDYPNARLLDIQQLMTRLKQMKQEGKNQDITVTVFVDENLYFKNPITGEEDHGRSLWKLTTDKEDRVMHLIVNEAKFSQDNNSSVITAQYTFKQRSIQTIYNVENNDLKTAWGLESKMETSRLKTGDVSAGTESRNGRANCLNWLVGKKWTEIISTTGNAYQLNRDYENAAYACLLRNRDLNGDNVVDPREIRWYLAAIDQLTDIFIGEYALDEQSRLYPPNKADRENMVRWHYTSSSYNTSGGGAWIIWAEEGASRGGAPGSIDDNGNKNEVFSYRCVRNLGLSLDNPAEIPDDFVTVSSHNDGYLIDMTKMNIKARRSTPEVNALPAHNERSDLNRPYARFVVHSNYYPSNGTNEWDYYQTYNGYPTGYRAPNQRELLIVSTRLESYQWDSADRNYMTQTAFSMDGTNPYNDKRDGFFWNKGSGNFILLNGGEKGVVRPVKDIQ